MLTNAKNKDSSCQGKNKQKLAAGEVMVFSSQPREEEMPSV
jgi:hypothetical protein